MRTPDFTNQFKRDLVLIYQKPDADTLRLARLSLRTQLVIGRQHPAHAGLPMGDPGGILGGSLSVGGLRPCKARSINHSSRR